LHAVAGKLIHIPTHDLNANAIVGVLRSLNLTIPTAVAAAAAKGESLRGSHRYSVEEVDAVLAKANVSISDRLRLKAAMHRSGIFGK
jgi:hypothetical protein